MQCNVIPTVVNEKAALRAACRSAQMRVDHGMPYRCRLVFLPMWFATYRCEIRRFLLPARTGLMGAGEDAFTGFVSLAAGVPKTELCEMPPETTLPSRFDWPSVSEPIQRQVVEYFVHKFRRVPDAKLEQFSLIYRPTWACVLGIGSGHIVRCIDAHSGDPLYYLDEVAEEITPLVCFDSCGLN